MVHAIRVDVPARSRPVGGDVQRHRALPIACACSENVEGGDLAASSAQEAVIHTVLICVVPCDRTRRVDATKSVHVFGSVGALISASAGTGNVNRRQSTIGSTQETVKHIVRIDVETNYFPSRIDAGSAGTLASASACVGVVELCDGAAPRPLHH